MSYTRLARLVATPGEPAGIGPDLCLQLAQQALPFRWVVLADVDLLQQRSTQLGLTIQFKPWEPGTDLPVHTPGRLYVHHQALASAVHCGRLDTANAAYVLQTLRTAAGWCQQDPHMALVTGPVNKAVINEAGIAFSGHTEFLADLAGCQQVVMMLATPGLRVALVTTHLPLRAVPDQITTERLDRVIRILHKDLQHRFGIPQPRILVCGLNPHAGEDGHLGHEETMIIEPLLNTLRDEGLDLRGPLSADSLFVDSKLAGADAVLAMYHDQGLPVLKHMGFGRAINITLGLPFIRTSVDHGTALELAGTGRTDSGSLRLALETAWSMLGCTEEEIAL